MTRQELLKIAKPILFNTPMTRAVLDDRKTATRRAIKGLPDCIFCSLDLNPEVCYDGDLSDCETLDGLWATFEATGDYAVDFPMRKAKYKVGHYLYVRETWCTHEDMADVFEESLISGFYYRADEAGNDWVNDKEIVKWRPSIHMPKAAARIFLKVTDVRVEKLHDITEEQAVKEGCSAFIDISTGRVIVFAKGKFNILWRSTIKKQDLDKYGWNANPWVWVYEFERVEVGE